MGKKDTDKEELELELEPEQQDAPATEEDAPAESPAAEEEKPDELEQLKKENADLSDRLLRQLAEFDNFRKRTAREKDEIGVVAKSKCILELLPVLDNFERAMTAECADAEFKKGMELIFKSMKDAFKKLGSRRRASPSTRTCITRSPPWKTRSWAPIPSPQSSRRATS